ncbi:MAG: Nramp family divalent metal transporter [Ignavibacteriae bacterium]|nr:Nramp family divalent metal transporter [Ignavibacteriota bacterium]
MLIKWIKSYFQPDYKPRPEALNFMKFLGPGLLVTIGFIDPGNWAANIAAGSNFGYSLLWIMTLSTIMLIILQHNVAHLGIATGLCLSEAASVHMNKYISKTVLITAMLASISTSLAEVLGGAIALNMLFNLPIKAGALVILAFVFFMLYTNSYRKIEKWIIGFVSIIGFSFIYELTLVDIDWGVAVTSWVTPSVPEGSILLVMSVLGAVVMPHNLFLHSEIIQSRQWNLQDEKVRKKQLDFEFFDTLFSMIVGWGINSAIVILAAATFFANKIPVEELQQAEKMLEPLLGKSATIVFAIALLFAGVSSSITSGMAGGSIFAGIFKEPYDIKDKHSKMGVGISLIIGVMIIFLISNPFQGLIISQMILSIQLPFTIFTQIFLTSSKKVMGEYKNNIITKIVLLIIGSIVTYLNVILFISFF